MKAIVLRIHIEIGFNTNALEIYKAKANQHSNAFNNRLNISQNHKLKNIHNKYKLGAYLLNNE